MDSLISLQHVTVEINQHKILDDVSLALNAKQIITILGPNGAGKSTLIKVILGLIMPTKGEIIRRPDLTIGYVPQSIQFNPTLPITVKRFMQLTCPVNEISDMLTLVAGRHLLNKSMYQLSGGERQRVLLALALSKRPQLLILDEPTQGVDVNGQTLLYDLIMRAKEQFHCGVLMVSHDLDLVMTKTDEVVCLNRHICCSGTPSEVIKSPAFALLFNHSPFNNPACSTSAFNHVAFKKGDHI